MNQQRPDLDLYPYVITPNVPDQPIDWRTVRQITPFLICMTGWVCWVAYLVIPTFSGSHGTTLYPLENNIMFVAAGLVMMLATQTAWRLNHLIRLALFASGVFFLAYWF